MIWVSTCSASLVGGGAEGICGAGGVHELSDVGEGDHCEEDGEDCRIKMVSEPKRDLLDAGHAYG